ncbi:hypothetical protein [Microbacterium sp. MYb62]|uniref:hypothetical protein n=1 Tax=Microbacterium sp. MYb62 TaxID=1848690 RepID=UPI000CFD075D|nr:hypothetical protein [Microbacterium sp. MYb62]PRB18316.1 hypothetical protein CQ042_03230 [Microbacterium sp. MYb62]
MTDQPIGSVSGSEVSEADGTDRTAARTIASLAIVVGIISLVLTAALLIPYYALQNPWIIPVFVVAAAGAIVAIVLGRRSRRAGAGSRGSASLGLAAGLTALLIDIVLLIVFIVGIWSPPLNRVQLEGTGPQAGVTASFSGDTETRTLPWPAVGSAQYTTAKSSTWITITAPSDSENQTVGCKIYWNDELVVEETSDSGTVSCEYDAD